jgi:two-component system, chemotaxis family, response regulator Rcp1
VDDSRLVLVIEDSLADVRLIREALRDSGLQVTLEIATDGEQALNFLNREGAFGNARRPSLIFLDLNLPRGTSKDILRFIKSDPGLRTIPVAVLTSSNSEGDVREAYELHANCYLRKPIDLDSFVTTIRSTISFWFGVACVPAEWR